MAGRPAICKRCNHRLEVPFSHDDYEIEETPLPIAPIASPAPARRVRPHTKEPDEKYCSDCGAAIKTRAEICPHCGVRQIGARASRGQKSRAVAVLLALLLGGLGAHKFYLGHLIMGMIYLLFCWTFIPAFVAFIEAIIYACMSDEGFQRRYG
jgi:predicted RNA-binding Zn-ribbon protein involved in translation (DUF1610 family)